MKQKITYIFIILLALIGLNLIISNKSYAIAVGTVGKYNCPWEVTDDGILLISEGIIEVDNPDFYSWPWLSYTAKIKQVKINGNVICNGSLSYFFYNLQKCTEMDLKGLNTTNVTDMSKMFYGCNFESIDFHNLNTTNVTDMSYMFYGCNFTSIDLNGLNTSKVTNMDEMFYDCKSLTELDLSKFDTSNVIKMYGMFKFCFALKDINLKSFNTSNVTTMYAMFYGCSSLKKLDLSNFDTSNVIYMDLMFAGCTSLRELDLSTFSTNNLKSCVGMFANGYEEEHFGERFNGIYIRYSKNSSLLTTIYVSESFYINDEMDTEYMFANLQKLKGGNGTEYDENYITGTYAVIDNNVHKGYLTDYKTKNIIIIFYIILVLIIIILIVKIIKKYHIFAKINNKEIDNNKI